MNRHEDPKIENVDVGEFYRYILYKFFELEKALEELFESVETKVDIDSRSKSTSLNQAFDMNKR
jgi:hypothetical protein